ncbi:aspartate ammonia-lyase [Candidatus Micrarchaeota archaeon]|nr:MAG: aspartate ammonia-lyase [Candidatus Micrarchaeota archaeon]
MHTRRERDVIGQVRVPADAYYGVFTQRARGNFKLSGLRAKPVFIKALALVKLAAAKANCDLKVLDQRRANAIARAGREVAAGKFADQFPLDVFQAGAGTPFNMNMNEVLANRANEMLGGKKGGYEPIHPNDHVNMGQSSNDVIPAATRIAVIMAAQEFLKEAHLLEKELKVKSRQFRGIKKMGRTHLQDAVPTTLGNEFRGYASALRRDLKEVEGASERLGELGIGGTALGTGINAHPRFKYAIVKHLRKLTKLKLRSSGELVELAQNMNALLKFSGALRMCAVTLARIANDLKLLSSGPRGGLGELNLPKVQPGSSIMPGKINPSIPEAVEMCCYHVIGSDRAVELACMRGQLDLNTNTPLIAHELLDSLELMANCCRMFRRKCVHGIRADRKRIGEIYIKSNAYATALTPYLGYSVVAELVKESVATGRQVSELVLEKKLMRERELNRILRDVV